MAQEESVSFARKHRPTTLGGYIGNREVKSTVKRYIKNGRPQSILLEGASGCGKTTLARIIAKEYCCENRDPEEGACGECPTCKAFNDYIGTGVADDLPDIYEIDSSDNSGKKDMDSMLSSMEYPPMMFEWKVYIIDEAHLLSQGAMGRLLKSLEEPPENVLIILCTTDPEKLLDTIKNRCQLKCKITRPSTKDIVELLQRVCLTEDRNYDLAGLRMIASRSDNVVRDSLNNLEQVLTTRGNAYAESVSAEFSQVSDRIIFDFYQAYYEDNYVEYANIMYKIKMKYNFNQFIKTLTNFTVRGLYVVNSVDVENLAEDEIQSYLSLFKKFTPEEISRILSQLRQMSNGDIEANLMSFIYCKNVEKVSEDTSVTINEESVTLEDERLMRNTNLERLENLKLKEGNKSIQSELQEVSVSELGNFFNLQKVES